MVRFKDAWENEASQVGVGIIEQSQMVDGVIEQSHMVAGQDRFATI
ncbi:hypothetical protein ACFWF7_11200 [Nocardia sp. NPDC060256]